jgi:membrane protease YdiL (CAAX protease family)
MKKGLLLFFIFSIACYGIEEKAKNNSDEEKMNTDEISFIEHNLISKPSTPSIKKLEQSPLIITPIKTKSPTIAVSLSLLIPGLGHTYLNDYSTAGAIFGSSALGYSLVALNESDEQLQLSGLVAFQNTWFYGIYAAYRDARNFNNNFGFKYVMPSDNFDDLTLAPVNFNVLKKPEVWGGIIGALSIGAAVGYLAYHKLNENIDCSISQENIRPLFAFPIGIGEETFFRGYLQSSLSETFTPLGGIILSSLAFGAMHIPNAQFLPVEHRWRYYSFSVPFITTLGAYFSWLTYKNKSLKESVAIHVWYDFAIFLASSYAIDSAITKKVKFSISIPF